VHLGLVQVHRGHTAEAVALLSATVAAREARWGPEHPELVVPLATLAEAYIAASDGTAARASAQRAVAIARTSFGDRHPQTIGALGGLGYVCQTLGDNAGALAAFGEAVALSREVHGPHDIETGRLEIRLADALGAAGRLDDAIAAAEHALVVVRGAHPDESTPVADAMHYLARIEAARGDPDADEHFAEAARIFTALGDVETAIAVVNARAESAMRSGDVALARRLLDENLARQRELGTGGINLAATLYVLAKASVGHRPAAELRPMAEEARRLSVDAGLDADAIAAIDELLGELAAG